MRKIDMPKVNVINGWKTIKALSIELGCTVQAIYYRISQGKYNVADFGGTIIVKPKTSALNRR